MAIDFSFTHIDKTPVYYYDGSVKTFQCNSTWFKDRVVPWLKQLKAVSRTYGGSSYANIEHLRSQGFFVAKPGMHNEGRAMDLATVKWNGTQSSPINGDHASTTVSVRRRYFAVDALCRAHFRPVLDGNYNADHRNHFHCDDGEMPTICRKTSRADTVFVQALCNSFLGMSLSVDGAWGTATNNAFATAKSKLQVSGDPHASATAWKTFCERAAAHGFRNASFGYYAWYTLNSYYSWSSFNYPSSFIRHRDWLGFSNPASTATDRADATWKIRRGLTGQGISLESRNLPGHYLRHANSRLRLSPASTDSLFKADATFYPRNGLARAGGTWRSLEASNFPGSYIRHRNSELWLGRPDGTELFKQDATFSFGAPLAP